MRIILSGDMIPAAEAREIGLADLVFPAEELRTPEQQEHSVDLPAQTANPRRTILMEIPVTSAAE